MDDELLHLIRDLNEVYELLTRVQPANDGDEIVWTGPWFVPGPSLWFPTAFFLRCGQLRCRMRVGSSCSFELHWILGSHHLEFPPEQSCVPHLVNGVELWSSILEQVQEKLRCALADSSRHNRFVEENIPLEARTGWIKRRHTWLKHVESLLAVDTINALRRAADRGRIHERGRCASEPCVSSDRQAIPARAALSRRQYLMDVATGYDAAFPDSRGLTSQAKYARYADGRHGGLLFLADNDEVGFGKWFHGNARHGAHPFEIVQGVPHGIHLYAQHNEREGSWSYLLTVSEFDLYSTAAQMIIAFDAAGVPVAIPECKAIEQALQGEDDIQIGNGFMATHISDIDPRALDHVRWDPLPQIVPLTDGQESERIRREAEPDAD